MAKSMATYKMFKVEVPNGKCGSCNWEKEIQYVIADTQENAENLVETGNAGLCGDCMCDMLMENYVISKEE